MNAREPLAPELLPLESAADSGQCFHCGEPVPAGTRLTVRYQQQDHAVCCEGCRAVATTIIDGGFDAYYQRRQAWAASQAGDEQRRLELYDDARFQQRFVQVVGEDEQEVVLALDGLHCASCVWLAERAVAREAGVAAFDVNMMTRRARLRWQPSRLKLSQVLQALLAVGLNAEPFDQARRDERVERERKRTLRQLFVAGLGMMQVMMYVWPVYVSREPIEAEWLNLMRWACLWMTVPVVLYSALPMLQGAWRDVQQRRVGMDVPVALAIVIAFIASAWHTWLGEGEVYFDSITMFVFLLLWGRQLEARARGRAADALDDFMRLRPQQATRLLADGGRESVAVELLQAGDRIEIGSSDMLPADGILRSDRAELDVSLLTGESLPVLRVAGQRLPAGAVNCGAPLQLELDARPSDNALSLIGRLIDRAAADKPQLARTADAAARVFLVMLLVMAAVVAAVWWYVDPARVLPIVIALLVVSCPCALSLAMPAALAAATSALARHGVLVARGDALEALARADTMVLDKTGTLTRPQAVLTDIEVVGDCTPEQVLCWAAALEQGSPHPLGRAIVVAASGRVLPTVQHHRLLTGQGVEGYVQGRLLRVGQAGFVAADAAVLPARTGYSTVALGDGERVLAWLHLQAPLRRGAVTLPAALGQLGLQVRLLSGDRQPAVEQMAGQLAIEHAQGDLSPDAKLQAVQQLQAAGARVAMVGDGINDGPVLSAADVSVALGDGSELAQVSADVILMTDDLQALPRAIRHARRTMRIMRQNLWWASIYNLVAIPVAALGWLTPWQSALGMSLSSLLVVANAVRLLRWPKED